MKLLKICNILMQPIYLYRKIYYYNTYYTYYTYTYTYTYTYYDNNNCGCSCCINGKCATDEQCKATFLYVGVPLISFFIVVFCTSLICRSRRNRRLMRQYECLNESPHQNNYEVIVQQPHQHNHEVFVQQPMYTMPPPQWQQPGQQYPVVGYPVQQQQYGNQQQTFVGEQRSYQ